MSCNMHTVLFNSVDMNKIQAGVFTSHINTTCSFGFCCKMLIAVGGWLVVLGLMAL